MSEFTEHWITTFTGKKLHYLNPQPDEICIEDIAHALALTCRFGGHCCKFYSVAEHSVRVAQIVDRKDKLAALLHDAHEAYLHDVPRPIKQDISGYARLASNVQLAIHDKFDVTLHYPEHLQFVDDILLATETRDLMSTTQDWAGLPMPLEDKINPMDWRDAERLFLNTYYRYGGVNDVY